MRILFITSSRIGDAVISCGILEHLRTQHPKARFAIACGAAAAGIFSRLPGLDRIIVFEKQKLDLHWLHLWTQLRGRRWDIIVDVRGSALALFLRATQRHMIRGGRRPGRRYQQLAAAMGISPAPLPVTWTGEADRARAAELLPPGTPIIGLGPTANWDGKIWPPERFVETFHALAEILPGARPAIFAGPGDTERLAAADVLQALPGAINLIGNLSLPQVAACMSRLTLFIGNDSGLMHIAAAAGAPTHGLFGRSKADEYAPAGPRTAIAIAPGPDGNASMKGLTVDAVLHAAKTLL